MKPTKQFEVAPGIMIDQQNSPGMQILTKAFNNILFDLEFIDPLFEYGFRSYISEETRSDGTQYYSFGIYHDRTDVVSSTETHTEEVARMLSEAMNAHGFGVEAHEYGVKINIPKADAYKVIKGSGHFSAVPPEIIRGYFM